MFYHFGERLKKSIKMFYVFYYVPQMFYSHAENVGTIDKFINGHPDKCKFIICWFSIKTPDLSGVFVFLVISVYRFISLFIVKCSTNVLPKKNYNK